MDEFPVRLIVWIVFLSFSIGVPALRMVYRRRASSSWPEVEGTVEQHKVFLASNERDVRGYGFNYSYRADGDYFAGEMLVSRSFKFPKSEDDVHRLYPCGSKVRVRHSPKKPDVSVVIPIEVPHRSVYFPPRDDPRE